MPKHTIVQRIVSFGSLRVGDPFVTVAFTEAIYVKLKQDKITRHNAMLLNGRKVLTKHFDDPREVYKVKFLKKKSKKKGNAKGK